MQYLRRLFLILYLLFFCNMAFAQSFPPLIVEEEDGSPTGVTTKIKVTNGALSRTGTVATITTGGGAAANDTVYGVGWNGSTDQAPSQNAVYDKIETISAGSGNLTAEGLALDQIPYALNATGIDSSANLTYNDTIQLLTLNGNQTMSNATWLGTGAATSRIAFTNQTSMSIMNSTLGIGTTNPEYKLDIVGDVQIQGSYAYLLLKDTTVNGTTFGIYSGFPDLGDFNIRESGVNNWLTIKKTTGNTGISTIAPTCKLDVNGTVNATQINRNGYTVLGKDNTTADLAELTNLYYTTARTRADVNATAPLTLTTGTFAIPKATSAADGYLNKTDWTTFNNSIDTEVDPTVDTSAEILAIIGNYAIPGIRITNETINSTQITDYSIVAADVTNYTLTGTQINNASNITVNTLTATGGTGVSSFTGPDNGVTVTVSINAASAAVTAADTFINFNSTAGAIGSIAGTAVSGVVAYNTMTFSHYTQVIDKTNIEPSMLLEIVEGKPDFDKKQLFKTRICRTKKSKQAIGTFGGTNKDGYDLCLAGGTAFVFVKNTGRNIGIGDLFYSSDMPGCVELQNDNTLHSYTVAKATEPIRWEKGEIKRLISCILLGG